MELFPCLRPSATDEGILRMNLPCTLPLYNKLTFGAITAERAETADL